MLRWTRLTRALRLVAALLAVIGAFGATEVAAQAPRVSEVNIVSSPPSGDTYGLQEDIRVSVRFDQAISTGGASQGSYNLALRIGSQTRQA